MSELLSNQVLAMLPRPVFEEIEQRLRRETLEPWQVLRDEHEPIQRVYFPVDGVISIVSVTENGGIAESYTAGCDGMAGSEIVCGDRQLIFRSMCQIPGTFYSMDAREFCNLAEHHIGVVATLRAYTHCLLSLAGRSGACNLLHPVVQRCARWLLASHDRVRKDTFELTHDILSTMLGVHRPAVSIAAGTLQKAGLISYTRGRITIADRAGLEQASCECYGVITREFCRVLGGPAPMGSA